MIDQSYKSFAWKQFKKNKPAYYSYKLLLLLIVIAILAPILANDQPLVLKYKGQLFFPAFSFSNKIEIKSNSEVEELQLDITDWKHLKTDFAIWAPVAYSPGKSDLLNGDYVGPNEDQKFINIEGKEIEIPTKFKHWLGTNKRGEDTLAGLIHGTRISLTIGILSMSIASFLGILFGALAGYFGDKKASTTRGSFIVFIVGLFFSFYYAFIIRSYSFSDALATSNSAFLIQVIISGLLFFSISYLFYVLGKKAGQWSVFKFNKKVFIPVDSIISRIIEILISLPRLILIISIAAIAKPSMVNLMVIIGFTTWTEIARFTRAELLRIQNMEYIQAARSLGLNDFRIILKHALPNGIAPALIAIAFGVASAILIESGLSFLGIGVPPETVTWGSLLNAGYENYNAWWLVIFPGMAIFITVTVYNLIGEGLRDALDPKLKN